MTLTTKFLKALELVRCAIGTEQLHHFESMNILSYWKFRHRLTLTLRLRRLAAAARFLTSRTSQETFIQHSRKSLMQSF